MVFQVESSDGNRVVDWVDNSSSIARRLWMVDHPLEEMVSQEGEPLTNFEETSNDRNFMITINTT